MSQEHDKLLKRIQKLVRQNQELIEHLKKSARQDGTLSAPTIEKPNLQKFKMVTVLFANIEGFYKLTENTDSGALMDQLDEVLLEFNAILKKYKIQKIKTIGDTYMAAGG